MMNISVRSFACLAFLLAPAVGCGATPSTEDADPAAEGALAADSSTVEHEMACSYTKPGPELATQFFVLQLGAVGKPSSATFGTPLLPTGTYYSPDRALLGKRTSHVAVTTREHGNGYVAASFQTPDGPIELGIHDEFWNDPVPHESTRSQGGLVFSSGISTVPPGDRGFGCAAAWAGTDLSIGDAVSIDPEAKKLWDALAVDVDSSEAVGMRTGDYGTKSISVTGLFSFTCRLRQKTIIDTRPNIVGAQDALSCNFGMLSRITGHSADGRSKTYHVDIAGSPAADVRAALKNLPNGIVVEDFKVLTASRPGWQQQVGVPSSGDSISAKPFAGGSLHIGCASDAACTVELVMPESY